MQDGLSGTAALDVPNCALDPVPVVETTKGVAATTNEVQTIKQFRNAPTGGTYTLSGTNAAGETWTTAGIAYNATAATIESAIDTAATGNISGWTNGDISVAETGSAGISDGNITLTFDGTSVAQEDHEMTIIDGSGLTGVDVALETILAIDTVALNSDDTDLVPVGARFTIAGESGSPVHTVTARSTQVAGQTDFITFTPALTGSAPSDNAVLTFLPQRLEIKIGDGDLSWTENRELLYDLDRDLLDTVRLGQEQPVEVDLAFIFEYVTTQSGQAITPIDALKRIGQATEWVSSAEDLCEPYAVDIYVVHNVPCGTDQDQDFLFRDFRYESLEYSIQDASISVSGRCNVSDVITTRGTDL